MIRRLLKSFKGTRKFSVFFALAMLVPITDPCNFIGVLLGEDNSSPICTPFVFVNPTGSGLPFGPVTVSWIPIQGATAYNIAITGEAPEALGNVSLDGSAKSASITLDQAGVTETLKQGGNFTIVGFALTGLQDPPFCEAFKTFTYTLSQKNHKASPKPTFTPPPPSNQNSGGGGSQPKKPATCPRGQNGTPPNCWTPPG